MLKFKAVAVLLIVILALGILAACGSNSQPASNPPATTQQETQPATTQTQPATTQSSPATTQAQPAATQAAPASEFKDGVYKVQINTYDQYGYAGLLELTVQGGKISAVNFDEITKDGKLKSADAEYRKVMEPISKTYPEKIYGTLKQQFLAKQSEAVDGIAGATQTTTLFKGMAKKALELARKGDTAPAMIPVP